MNQTESFSLGTLLCRVTSPTPDFQKKLQKLALAIGVLAGMILLVDKGVAHLIPPVMVTIAKITAIMCGTSAAHAQTTKDTPLTPTADDSQANNTAN